MTNWILKQDGFSSCEALSWEALFTQGSGYLQLRGSLEEDFSDSPQDTDYTRNPTNVSAEKFVTQNTKWGCYIPGVYSPHPAFSNEITNLPNPLGINIFLAGEKLDLIESEVSDFTRTLDLKTGLLQREMLWKSKSGATLTLKYRRFVSAKRKKLIVQQISITSDLAVNVEICSKIDANVRTNGQDHFTDVTCSEIPNGMFCKVETEGGNTVEIASAMRSDGWEFKREVRVSKLCKTINLKPAIPVTIEKRSTISCDRDRDNLSAQLAIQEVDGMDFDNLFSEHCEVWNSWWKKCDVEISGDDESQLAVRVSLYHLLRSQVDDDRVAICAKGFSGDAYFGHFFWDTEMFMMPFFLYTLPEKAKQLMDFRIHSLPGAQNNAHEYGNAGAKFAWQSDPDGNECCPKSLWQYRDHQVHVTADVVYGFVHYANATGDMNYLEKDAAKTIMETCRYWMDRIDYRNGNAVLLAVMGPDEYHPLVNNDAYTNRLVRCALETGVRVGPANGASPEEIQSWKQAAAGLAVLKRKDGLILQHENFDDLAEPDFDKHWTDRSKPYAAIVSQDRNYRSKTSKQPDVLMLAWLFANEFTEEQITQAWDYYVPYCTHDSSLSPGIHGLIALRLGLLDDAWAYWKETASLDLNVKKGKSAQGIHIACSAAIWQFLIFGFAGVKHAMESDILTIDPKLPKQWNQISFPLTWKGQDVKITINHDGTAVENKSEKPLAVNISGKKHILPGIKT